MAVILLVNRCLTKAAQLFLDKGLAERGQYPMASILLTRYEAEEDDLPDVCMRCGALATES